ncbi:MAG: hypothetical protein QNI84_11115 [Henriciella sp.]|nr:hypothetical protein [Henriciella sp.]
MSDETKSSGLTRRQTIAWTAAVAGALGVGGTLLMRQYHGGADDGEALGPYDQAFDEGVQASEGYGGDPDLLNPRRDYWPRTVSAPHLVVIDALADTVLPGDETRPAPSMIGIGDFFSEWLSAPYPAQRGDRALLEPFLEQLHAEGFANADKDAQVARAEVLHADETETAFARFLRLTAGAYYTTPEGAAIMGFIGNQPMQEWPGPPDDVIAHLEREAAKLTPFKSEL